MHRYERTPALPPNGDDNRIASSIIRKFERDGFNLARSVYQSEKSAQRADGVLAIENRHLDFFAMTFRFHRSAVRIQTRALFSSPVKVERPMLSWMTRPKRVRWKGRMVSWLMPGFLNGKPNFGARCRQWPSSVRAFLICVDVGIASIS